MKRLFFIAILLITAVCAYSQTGIIREISGEVELKPRGASAFVPAQLGGEVRQDTIVSTGFRSSAVIAIGSTVITVRPLTRLSLAEISSAENTENLNVNLQAGRVRVEVRPPAGTRANATVQSPSATASVRGTSYEMDVMSINVIDGTVLFSGNSGLPEIIQGGGGSTVNNDGSAQNPLLTSEGDLLPNTPGSGSSQSSAGGFSDPVVPSDSGESSDSGGPSGPSSGGIGITITW